MDFNGRRASCLPDASTYLIADFLIFFLKRKPNSVNLRKVPTEMMAGRVPCLQHCCFASVTAVSF